MPTTKLKTARLKPKNPIVESAEYLANAEHSVKLSRAHEANKIQELEEATVRRNKDEQDFETAKQRHASVLRGVK